MKIKLYSLLTFCLLSFASQAQVVRASLFTGFGVGLGSSSSSASVNLQIFDLSYAPKPNYDAGVYFDLGVGGNVSDDDLASVKAGASYGVQGKYYFLTNTFKPFVGLQMGLNSGGSAETDNSGSVSNVEAGTRFQLTPQAGFRVGPLNIWTSYRTNWGLSVHGGLIWGFGKFK